MLETLLYMFFVHRFHPEVIKYFLPQTNTMWLLTAPLCIYLSIKFLIISIVHQITIEPKEFLYILQKT